MIEIAVSDLYDEGAMVRHFRKLAGYLRADDLRETIRDDTKWFTTLDEEGNQPSAFTLTIVRPTEEQRYRSCVPLVPLKAAAGQFGDPQESVLEEDLDWVEIGTSRRLRKGMFVAQVVGRSMEPEIPDHSYCLFSAPVTGTRQGKTVLVQLRDGADPETGERYTVKRYQSEKVESDEGAWRHFRITLKPNNPDFEEIKLTIDDEGEFTVIAEFLEVVV